MKWGLAGSSGQSTSLNNRWNRDMFMISQIEWEYIAGRIEYCRGILKQTTMPDWKKSFAEAEASDLVNSPWDQISEHIFFDLYI